MTPPGTDRRRHGDERGIGYQMAAALAADGSPVAGPDVDGSNADSLREATPGRVAFDECDVSDPDDVERAVDGVVDRWDRVDILANNAAVATFAPFERQSLDDTRRGFEVSYVGYRDTTSAVLPRMRARGWGSSTTRVPRRPSSVIRGSRGTRRPRGPSRRSPARSGWSCGARACGVP